MGNQKTLDSNVRNDDDDAVSVATAIALPDAVATVVTVTSVASSDATLTTREESGTKVEIPKLSIKNIDLVKDKNFIKSSRRIIKATDPKKNHPSVEAETLVVVTATPITEGGGDQEV